MKWNKIGRIFDPNITSKDGLSCSLMPIVETIDFENDLIRVYFAPRDSKNRSQLNYFDINLNEPKKILNLNLEPIYKHGPVGAFDDCGVTPGSFVHFNNKKAYYYTGWSLTKTVPMNNSIGIAFYNENTNKFERVGDGPIMTRTLHEPYSCASPFVLNDNDKLRMWYASMDEWKNNGEDSLHVYNLKYAESDDGINWKRECEIALDYKDNSEYAFGRPFVLKESGLYKMWYAVRGDYYTIGYAESNDGHKWIRKDHLAGISVSETGWDSEMIEYPFIFDHKNNRYMFYNGNGYGRTGIGLAILSKE